MDFYDPPVTTSRLLSVESDEEKHITIDSQSYSSEHPLAVLYSI
jgi:hypothetical protein